MSASKVDTCQGGTEKGYAAHRRRGEESCAPCRTAATNARRDRRYSLKPGEWAEMHAAQGGRCFVCGSTPTRGLFVDHCHKSGAVRRLLCGYCNTALGMALESTSILRRLTLYAEGNLREAPGQFLGDLSLKGKRKPSGPLYKARAV